jgi:endonuclease-3
MGGECVDVASLPHPPPITDIHEAMRRVTEAVRDMPKPSMFQLASEGFGTPFEQLVACIISIRTLEETSLPVSRRLFAVARTAEQMAALPIAELERLITPSTFAERKAAQIHDIAARVLAEYSGELPCDGAVMQSFSGVGPKCANLCLGIACDQPTIPVDIHVHRVVNRWGYVHTKTPEQTLAALEPKLPMEYRPSINRILLPFGKYICTGGTPRCLSCPLIDICPKVGVTKARK